MITETPSMHSLVVMCNHYGFHSYCYDYQNIPSLASSDDECAFGVGQVLLKSTHTYRHGPTDTLVITTSTRHPPQ